MLQQTRVEAVIPYYERFLQRFPSLAELAAAPEQDVLTRWSGLGYYSRARNLHRAARQIDAQGLPSDYDQVRALPGVGPYTAAAIASIALALPHAAVDGNVIRVVSRLTDDASEITSPATRRSFSETAALLLDRHRPGDFNQAMMELGATVCTPRNPDCASCPVEKFCAARIAGTERVLPVRPKKSDTRDLALDLALVERRGYIFLMKRDAAERRLADFWELPLKNMLPDTLRATLEPLGEFRHRIVNDRMQVACWHIVATEPRPADFPPGKWVPFGALHRIPLTTLTKKALAMRRQSPLLYR